MSLDAECHEKFAARLPQKWHGAAPLKKDETIMVIWQSLCFGKEPGSED